MVKKNRKTTSKTISRRTNNSKVFLKKHLIIIFAIASFLIPFAIGSYNLNARTQLGYMNGMAEEYILLGINLHQTGKYEIEENVDFFFRPPGYPYFIDFALKFYDKIPEKYYQLWSTEEMLKALRGISDHLYFVQNILFIFISNIFII